MDIYIYLNIYEMQGAVKKRSMGLYNKQIHRAIQRKKSICIDRSLISDRAAAAGMTVLAVAMYVHTCI